MRKIYSSGKMYANLGFIAPIPNWGRAWIFKEEFRWWWPPSFEASCCQTNLMVMSAVCFEIKTPQHLFQSSRMSKMSV